MILSSDILFHWHSFLNLSSHIKNLFNIIFYILHHSKMSKVYIFNYHIPLKKNTNCFSLYSCRSDIFLFFPLLTLFLHRIPLFSIFLLFYNFLDIYYYIGKFFMSFSARDIFASLLGSFSDHSLFFSPNFFLFFLF